jgi:gluconate 2-dehydrogenase gamma chain
MGKSHALSIRPAALRAPFCHRFTPLLALWKTGFVRSFLIARFRRRSAKLPILLPVVYDASIIPVFGGVGLKRRSFLTISAAAAAATTACTQAPKSTWRVLADNEAAILDAWTACLIPTDQDPGAREANVIRFIDTQLAAKFKKNREAYRAATAGIDSAARKLHARGFLELEAAAQTALLSSMEKGEAPRDAFPKDGGKGAFDMVLAHTMMGFYGNPRHGGNRDYASWTMLGVPPMPVRGRLHYEQRGA